ncbi:hypothetical protein BH23ACT10_BH23ACT10_20960 [soil metagenome]
MRRPARLDSARAWLDSTAEVTLRGYARRYGVDRYTAHHELTMLGVTLPVNDEQWSKRPSPVPERAEKSRSDERESDRVDDGLPDGWMEWGGEIMFVVGFTSGGAPYGLRIDEFPPDDLPEELKGRTWSGDALIDEPLSRYDVWREVPDWEDRDGRDVPF